MKSQQMNKQELASRIWKISNELRGSIEASDYKDYILGFIFYKYLSDNEYQFLINEGYEKEDIERISEENTHEIEYIKNNIGYFIAPENLFQNWIAMGNQFTVDNVMTALSAFQRNISSNPQHQKVFGGIFNTLETGITTLGSNTAQRTRQVRSLVELIQDIPTVNDEYDVLGYIYEYLIGKFAAGAGKSSGEFFSPVKVSSVISAVISEHLKDKETIEVYDPTSGSGSLLLNIGTHFEQDHQTTDNVKYYAQEYMATTEILTRMNLLMRGVKPANIVTRNGDSLEEDFPYFDESDPEGTYEPVFVDAVVSNPPYSQSWDPTDKDQDPRFAGYGLAPKSKADYAFLLHGLYHLNSDGMLGIVLPHGILFRGEEKSIRQKLIEKNHIETIIGLPANIFYGTGIPTTVLFLRKERTEDDILFIDASKGFEKVGNKNDLRPMDVQRLIDVTIERKDVDKYSRVVSKEEVIENDYNLNIPRYVDSNEEEENWDILSIVGGGIPTSELAVFDNMFKELPGLYNELFEEVNDNYVQLRNENVHNILDRSSTVNNYQNKFEMNFKGLEEYLEDLIIKDAETVNLYDVKDKLVKEVFARFEDIRLIDKYEAYEILDDVWTTISNDIQLIQQSSLNEAVRAVDANMVIKRQDGKDVEVQEGEKGRIIPFELVQKELLSSKLEHVEWLEDRQIEIQEELDAMVEGLSEEEGEYDVLNKANTQFSIQATRKKYSDLFEDIEIPALNTLIKFNELPNRKAVRLEFMEAHPEIEWNDMDLKKDGTPSVRGVRDYQNIIKSNYQFEEETFGHTLSKVIELMSEDDDIKDMLKEEKEELENKTKETIMNLTFDEMEYLLNAKWIQPIVEGIYGLSEDLFVTFEQDLLSLHEKYATTMKDIQKDIQKSNTKLSTMMDQLTADESDMQGIQLFQELLGGDI